MVETSRAVEVLHDRGAGRVPRWTVASGFLIGGRYVLTAAHAVDYQQALTAGQRLLVRRRWPLPAKYTARIALAGTAEVDLALVEIDDSAFDGEFPPVGWARIDRDNPEVITGCWAVGFPAFKQQHHPGTSTVALRDSVQVGGRIHPGSNRVAGTLELQVTATPRDLPEGKLAGSVWEGMSGAVVFAPDSQGGQVAVGVVAEHHRPGGVSCLTLAPVTALPGLLTDDHPDAGRVRALPAIEDPRRWTALPPPATAAVPRRLRVGNPPRVADHFQHRAAVDTLAEAVDDGGTAVLCQVLAGMGGVGKTQLAAHYAHQMWQAGQVDVLIWVVAANRQAIQTAYATAAAQLCGADPTDPAAAAEALWGWLATTDLPWLVVLDDLADPDDLAGLWPPEQTGGRVLVTTRRRDAALVGPGRHRIDVDLFTPAQAAGYLTAALAAYGRTDHPDQITGLTADLGWLPLALSQAAAYLIDLDLDCATYRARLADHSRTLADVTPDTGLPDNQQTTITAAWTLSIDRANQLRPAGLARPLLQLAALLDPNGIPEAALTAPPTLDYLATIRPDQPAPTADDTRDALRTLHRLSLANHTHGTVRVHQLLQRAVRDTLTGDQAHALARTAADALLHIWPDTDPDGTLTQTLRANTTTLHTLTGDHLHQPDLHTVLFHAGTSLGDTGLLAAAIDHFHHLHQFAYHHHGPDHPHTLATRANLAYWRGEAGDPVGAAATTETLLADQMRVLGPDHPHTLATRNHLAHWRGKAGDPVGAAAAFETLLQEYLRVLGPDHPDTLTTRSHLARWRGEAGDPVGAAATTETLLADQMRVLGPDHPHTLATRNHLAYWRGEAGDPVGAAAATETLLADQMRVLGPDHLDTLATRSNLAYWRGEAGDPAGAAAAFETLLADQMRVLGPDHPDTLTTRSNLAYWRGEAGDPVGAAAATETLLADQMRVLGPDHPDTLATRSNLARWRGKAGDPAGAAAAFETLLADQMRVLGPDHLDTLATRSNLARWRGEAGDPAGAAATTETLLQEFLRVLSPDHPHTLTTRNNLAYWRGQAGTLATESGSSEGHEAVPYSVTSGTPEEEDPPGAERPENRPEN